MTSSITKSASIAIGVVTLFVSFFASPDATFAWGDEVIDGGCCGDIVDTYYPEYDVVDAYYPEYDVVDTYYSGGDIVDTYYPYGSDIVDTYYPSYGSDIVDTYYPTYGSYGSYSYPSYSGYGYSGSYGYSSSYGLCRLRRPGRLLWRELQLPGEL